MIKSYKIKKNRLTITSDQGEVVKEFSCPVREVFEYKNSLIIRLQADKGDATPELNVYRVDERGQQIWQIEDPQELYPNHRLDYKKLFSGIILRPEGVLYAFDRYSRNYVDPNTGKILKDEFTK